MRPKKRILVVDGNKRKLSIRTFLLETRGYRVIPVSSAAKAIEAIENALPGAFNLMLCELILPMPQMDGNELVRRAKDIDHGLRTMIVSDKVSSFVYAGCADVFLPAGSCSPAEVLERVRILVTRKRGPKKKLGPRYQPQVLEHHEIPEAC